MSSSATPAIERFPDRYPDHSEKWFRIITAAVAAWDGDAPKFGQGRGLFVNLCVLDERLRGVGVPLRWKDLAEPRDQIDALCGGAYDEQDPQASIIAALHSGVWRVNVIALQSPAGMLTTALPIERLPIARAQLLTREQQWDAAKTRQQAREHPRRRAVMRA